MKVLLIRFFTCLAIAASFASGTSARILASDLAYSEFHHVAFRSNCFHVETNLPASVTQSTSLSAAVPLDNLTSNFALLASLQDSVLQTLRLSHIPSVIFSTLHSQNNEAVVPTHSLTVNRPEAGKPPIPVVTATSLGSSHLAKRSLTKLRFLENYRPYDLAVRDWKFGQFSQDIYAHAVQTGRAVSKMSLVNPNHAMAQLADALYRLEELQCQASEELNSMRCVASWSQTAVQSAFKLRKDVVALTTKCLQNVKPNTPQQPYFTEPMLVAYQSSDGKQFVFTIDQARQWGLVGSFRELMPQQQKVVGPPRLAPAQLYAAWIARISAYQDQAMRLTRWLNELRIASTTAPELH